MSPSSNTHQGNLHVGMCALQQYKPQWLHNHCQNFITCLHVTKPPYSYQQLKKESSPILIPLHSQPSVLIATQTGKFRGSYQIDVKINGALICSNSFLIHFLETFWVAKRSQIAKYHELTKGGNHVHYQPQLVVLLIYNWGIVF